MRIFFLAACFILSAGILAIENPFHPAWKESSAITAFTDLGNGSIATGLENKTVLVWNLTNRKFKALTSNTSIISSIAHSDPSGKIAYQSDESKIKILSPDLETNMEIPNSLGSITSLDFSPDGLKLVGGDENGRVRIWDLSGKIRGNFQAHSLSITSVQFSPDGRSILTASEDGTASLWNTEGTQIKVLDTRDSPILCAKISKDGKKVATGGDDGKIREIFVEDGKKTEIGRHTSSVRSVVYSKTGKYLLSSSEDLTVKIWDTKTGLKATLVGHSDTVNQAIFINDEKQILTGSDDGTQKIFDINGKELANIVLTDKGKIVFDPSGGFDYDSEFLESYFYFNTENVDIHSGLDSFYSLFFSPGLIQKIFKGSKETRPSVSDLINTSPPPRVDISLEPSSDRETVSVSVKACDEGGGVGDLYLYHNDSLVSLETSRAIRLIPGDTCVHKTFSPDLSPGENYFRVSSASKAGIVGYSKMVSFHKTASGSTLPKLHLVLLAVDDYKGKSMDLRYAVKDALALSGAEAFKKKNIFSSTKIYTAYDRKADKKGILSIFEEVAKESAPEDLLLVFIAGHGANQDGKFYFLTSTFDPENPNYSENGFSQEDFVSSIAKVNATRKLLIFDTCDSGGEWTTQFKELGNLAKSAGLCVIASTLEKEDAYESSALEHGVFTTALLEGLGGRANTNGKVTASSLISYINLRVPEIAKSVIKKEQFPYSSQRGRDFVIAE
ncbi:hypothetical protein EHQ53_00020 [Leptospira langatensis]|uniref:Peptidase C14 caspase domain-containing protein n=1 Tax=Leptospira langatensis TaxID=2484983 RepID=A0A5F1ZW69_9LEPT|nr:caspase family protein [Leptospira langatensis]TGJ98162.1 hypothetical protein EHO57_16165 [Leptospira langatensis]TGL43076.1 hypothetical protein EHQ53_00020 [Leptospira langatensis]